MYLNTAIVSSPSTVTFLARNRTSNTRRYVTKRRVIRCELKKKDILKNSNIVSRVAMLGVSCGSAIEYFSHKNYIDQVQLTYPYVIVTGLIIGYATFKTMKSVLSQWGSKC